MGEKPRVSVIIAAFEAERFLGRAIGSARAQTLSNVEIIVIDDASTDGTSRVAREHASQDPRVVLVSLPTNAGPGAARNAGLARASGDWIAILDADDAFKPDRLERLTVLGDAHDVEMIADNPTLNAGAEPPRRLITRDAPWPLHLDPLSFIAANQGAWGQDRVLYGFLKPLVRRAFLQTQALRYRELRLAEDYFFFLEALLLGARWMVIAESFYDYTVRPDSLTSTFSPRELDAMAEADRRVLDDLRPRLSQPVAAAIRRHRAEAAGAAAWTRLVLSIRQRNLGVFMQSPPAGPPAWAAMFRQMIRAAPRVVHRFAQRGGEV